MKISGASGIYDSIKAMNDLSKLVADGQEKMTNQAVKMIKAEAQMKVSVKTMQTQDDMLKDLIGSNLDVKA
jgi:3-polyprenyl-4-hydroxybenzoate decarboxylase